MKLLSLSLLILLPLSCLSVSASPDWSDNASIEPGTNRRDIYDYGEQNLEEVKRRGYLHALRWPVSVTGLLMPYRPLKYLLDEEKEGPIRRIIENMAESKIGYKDTDGLYEWIGLNNYPDNNQVQDIFRVPYPTINGEKPTYRMGVSLFRPSYAPNSDGLTFSCVTCHSGSFMGYPVMGLTNKRPRANEFFVMAQETIPYVPSGLFRLVTKATKEEQEMFKRMKSNVKWIGAVSPQVLGLDTSLPHVALSLHKRKDDEFASKEKPRRKGPHKLQSFVADSKPMPWWNLKYKTRWLSDGSVISGNPILTNFLWNEIGRGTDLLELETWMENNQESIQELTAAAFATESPQWTDFFPTDTLNLSAAKRGEVVFNKSCKHCHGRYEKRWSYPLSDLEPLNIQIKTERVFYHQQTPVIDVGTDPNRWMAMSTFSDNLNKLRISKAMKTKVVPQEGYVPPPLDGIFLRYPYFHNNSIPNLCALMMRPDQRPVTFVQGPADKKEHFDSECVGYPVGENIPENWLEEKGAIFDATKSGLLNSGHSSPFYDEEGMPRMSENDKRDLIEFLKTL